MTKRILVVDDDRVVRTELKELLEIEGFQVSVADNGRQALDTLDTEQFDLIIFDLRMPVMDGWEFVHALQARPTLDKIPRIILSASDPKGRQFPMASAILPKLSLTYRSLMAAITELIDIYSKLDSGGAE